MTRIALTLCLMLSFSSVPLVAQEYILTPDSQKQPGVPEGKITAHTWTSKIYPGTVRDYWVYVPAQYDGSKPAAVMVFQDGGGMKNTEGDRAWMTPVVLDNLIYKGDMPVTIAIFIDPGVLPARNEEQQARYNRSFEYDALGDRYARFLLEEILPEVGKTYKLTDNPNLRGISGSSSGGIAAFTAAWNRPDAFRRVLSFIGSYTDLRGGNIYPALVRKTEPKPLRVFLQDGANDLNIYSGWWWIANQDLAAALEYSHYDSKFVRGTESHNNIQGRAILPAALQWLWRDWEAPIKASKTGGERQYVMDFLDPASGWEQVSSGHTFTEGPALAPNGDVYFSDTRASKIWKIGNDDKVSLFKDNTQNANGLMFGPDGLLYGCQGGANRLISFTTSGEQKTVAEVTGCNDLVVTEAGNIYYTDPENHQVWYLPKGGQPRVVHEGIDRADRAARGTVRPNGVAVSPDQSLLFVADSWSKWTWSFQIQADGSLANEQAFYRLESPDASSASNADGMTVAADGHLYIATAIGVQICDQPGRVVGIINKPQAGALSNAVFAGPDLKTLYVTAGDKVFRRRMRVPGFYPWKAVKPPRPRL